MKLAVKPKNEDKTFSLEKLINSDKFKQWINPKNVVMIHDTNHDTSLDYATYIVITKSSGKYSISRFFTIGTTIHVSVDANSKSAEEIFPLLMTDTYSKGTN